jgi:mono/diheme cytochrome c family protein
MKRFSIVLAALAMMLSIAAFAAEDGAALYKAKCAACHGASAEGKGAAPALKGKTNVVDVLTNGGKKGIHAKAFNVTPDQAKAIAGFLK